jgi:hypothetical protein
MMTPSYSTRRSDKKVYQSKKPSANVTKKKVERSESAPPPVECEYRPMAVTLLPEDENECQKIHDKLQRLQPDGACADMNTLRRALYPPIGTNSFMSTGTISSSKSILAR